MARPKKDGVDYFPFDVDFLNDVKIKTIRARCGAEGVMLYVYLLCEIYRDKGYYLEWNEDSGFLIAAELGMSTERVDEIMSYLLGRSLFDAGLFERENVLTSKGVQRRYQYAIKARAAKNPVTVRGELWLLGEEKTEASVYVRRKDEVSVNEKSFSENNLGFSRNNPGFSENNSTKQSKVKQSKVNESKAEQSKAEENESISSEQSQADAPELSGDGCCCAEYMEEELGGDAYREFERIKRPTARETERITDLVCQYGKERVISAIRETHRKGGRSLAYAERILEDIGRNVGRNVGRNTGCSSPKYRQNSPGAPPRSDGCHQATYDADEIDAMMYDEWFGDEMYG